MNETNPHHEELRELLVPYSLRQLDADDRAIVERALDADPVLRAELDEIEATGAALLGELPRVSAPASVKSGVMAAVRASHSAVEVDTPVAVVADERVAPSRPAAARARRRWFGAPVFAGAMAAACVVLALVAIDLSGDLDDANDRADRLEQQVDGAAAGAPAGFANASLHTVATTDDFGDATGSLIQVDDDTWVLAFNDVPEPAQGTSWQVWTAHENGMIQNVAQWADGDASRVLVLDADDIVEVMVSYEPSTEPVPVPSGDPVADVKV